jgi:hypothetical protein
MIVDDRIVMMATIMTDDDDDEKKIYKIEIFFLGAKSTSIRDCVRRSVGWSVGPLRCDYVETRIRGNAIISRRGRGN